MSVNEGSGGAGDDDAPPTNIMYAAYIGAFDIVKSMIEVSRCIGGCDLLHISRMGHII